MILLIRDINQLRELVTFNGDLDYRSLQPALRSAQEFLSRYVGPDLLGELEEDPLPIAHAALLPYVLVPIANLTLLKFANAGNVRITDLGVQRTKTAESGDAFEWQLDRVVTALKTEAFDGIEALLRYLEAHLGTFPAYADSDQYATQKDRLIQSAGVFSQYYDIGSSRLVLQTFQASMRTAEIRTIRPLLGTELPALLGSNLSDAQIIKLDAARRALAYLTVARALREKLVSISDAGVQVNGISQFATIRYQQPASDKQLATTIAYFDKEAALFLGELAMLLKPPSTDTGTGSRLTGTRIVSF